jgi:hypothetical protein
VSVRAAAVVLWLAVGWLLTGCTGDDLVGLLDRVPAALEEAETSRFEMEVVSGGEPGEPPPFRAEGEQDLRTGAMRMVFDLGGTDSRAETLLDGDLLYLRAPLFALFTGDADAWIRVDLEEAGAEAGLDPDQLVPTDAGPTALLQQLRGADEDVEDLGREEIRGVSTRHLRVMVDSDRAVDQTPEELRKQRRTSTDAAGLPSRYPMEVWIDDDGLPRRIRTVLEVDEEGTDRTTHQTTLDLYDFGVSVDVTPPDAADVVDIDQLLQQLAELEAALDG